MLKVDQRKAIVMIVAKDINGLTYKQIADNVGISVRQLQRWKNDPEFTESLTKQVEQFHKAFIVEAYAALRSIISSKDTADNNKLKAIEMYLRSQGLLKDRAHTIVTASNELNSDISFVEILAGLN